MQFIQKFKPGDLVKWHGGPIARSPGNGVGVIVNEQIYKLANSEINYTNYRVYRNKHNDIIAFDPEELAMIQ